MTKSQTVANRRVDTINSKLRSLRRQYEHSARCSAQNDRAYRAMSALEHERDMLVTIHQLQR